MVKRFLSILLVMVLLCTMLPQVTIQADAAAYRAVMTAYEFIDYLKVALSRKTAYSNKAPYNLGYYNGDTISWDCWNLGKTIIWSKGEIVNNYTPNTYVYRNPDPDSGLGDWPGDYIVKLDPNYSTDFTNIVPGEWVQMSGHTGYYIGDGQVIECTNGLGANGVVITQIDAQGRRSRNGQQGGTWLYHGKVPFLDYEASPVVKKNYPSNCITEVTADTTVLKSMPCDVSLDETVVDVEQALKGTQYHATKLVQNVEGQLWYEVTAQNGQLGYLNAADSVYRAQRTDDLTVTGVTIPALHTKGYIFYLTGTISSTYNQLTGVSAYIYPGSNTQGTAETGAAAAVSGNTFTLKGSTVDNKTAFGTLALGNHTYVLSASYQNYYASSATEVAENTGTVELLTATFSVVSSVKSCSHAYSEQIVSPATCVDAGKKAYTCGQCGTGYTERIPVVETHRYEAATTTEATCTTDGVETYTCKDCFAQKQETVAAFGHTYDRGACITCGEYDPSCARLSGTVISFGNTSPVTVRISNQNTEYSQILNDQEFVIPGLAAGEYQISFSKANHVTRAYTLVLGEGQTALDAVICLIGDVTGDGNVNVGDVAKAYSHIRKTMLLTDEYQLLCANVNGGSLNVGDVASLYSHVKGTAELF